MLFVHTQTKISSHTHAKKVCYNKKSTIHLTQTTLTVPVEFLARIRKFRWTVESVRYTYSGKILKKTIKKKLAQRNGPSSFMESTRGEASLTFFSYALVGCAAEHLHTTLF